jgi:CHRD domain-containing protein
VLELISLNGYLNGVLVPCGFLAHLGVATLRTRSIPEDVVLHCRDLGNSVRLSALTYRGRRRDWKKGRPINMQHREGTRRMSRVGACLAFISSILVLTLPTPAVADEVGPEGYGYFSIQLTGKEVPHGGDPEGQGYARLDLNPEHETACFDIKWKSIEGAVTALHLHAAPRGSEGPRWIDLFSNKHFPGARNTVSGCVHVDASHGMSPRDKIRAAIQNPSGFYLNVRSTKLEDGAIRGQLG